MAGGRRMTLSLAVANRRAVVANLMRAYPDLVERLQRAVAETGGRTYQRAYDLAPKRTHFMVRQLKLRFSANGLVAEVGYDERDFRSRGLFPYFFSMELGFLARLPDGSRRWVPPQPHLGPAHAENIGHFQSEMRHVMQEWARRRRER